MKRFITVLVAVIAAFGVAIAAAQEKKTRISIGTGGVYYPLGGGLAALISKYVPGVEATAEVTAGSIANLQLIDTGKSEIGFTMADAAWDAAKPATKELIKIAMLVSGRASFSINNSFGRGMC